MPEPATLNTRGNYLGIHRDHCREMRGTKGIQMVIHKEIRIAHLIGANAEIEVSVVR